MVQIFNQYHNILNIINNLTKYDNQVSDDDFDMKREKINKLEEKKKKKQFLPHHKTFLEIQNLFFFFFRKWVVTKTTKTI